MAKYVRFKQGSSKTDDFAVIFPDFIEHIDIVKSLENYNMRCFEAVSAGFVDIHNMEDENDTPKSYGKSLSANLKPSPDGSDDQLLKQAIRKY
jgi:hypothetical protein